ncbi:hypothetical protein AVEN_201559-1 [Araneus ventricosus]|uniref:Uncharacterized protein n=1 Tax=Araneus ventricosus TaxID=182803 RepID=A0A4Y2I5T0_ARAVE|nr:hypothetical protein AVEN_201559-1 [Araneus ventricosus]
MTDQGKDVFDRLAALISGVPGFKEGKLFSFPAILNGISQSQANKVFEIVEDWGLSENISALCFDTTASSSEWKNGACVQLESHLKSFKSYHKTTSIDWIEVMIDFSFVHQIGARLKNNPQAWEEDFMFKEMKTFNKNLKLGNDTAEWRAKLMEDFGH